MNIASIIDNAENAAKMRPRETSNMAGTSEPYGEHGTAPKMSRSDIVDTVERLNRAAVDMKERVSFGYNDKTNSIIVKFIDKENNEVVREFPERDLMKIAEHIHDYLGMLVDESR